MHVICIIHAIHNSCFAGETSAFDVSFPIVDVTLRQLEKLEQDLEKLSTQVQTMKENLEATDRQQRKCNTDNILKLTEVNSSVS